MGSVSNKAEADKLKAALPLGAGLGGAKEGRPEEVAGGC